MGFDHRSPARRAAVAAILCLAVVACARGPLRDPAPGGASDPRPAAGAPAAAPVAGAPDATPAADRTSHPDARAYVVDPVHTRIAIAVDHAGFSKAIGTVSGTTGTLHVVPGGWDGARVEVRIPVADLDFGDPAWNRAVAARGLLDTGSHPVAHFRSLHVEPVDAVRARIHGALTLRGVTRPVVLEAVRNAERRHPLPPFRRTIGFSATSTLSREAFGSTAWSSVIGDDVEVRIELEATAL